MIDRTIDNFKIFDKLFSKLPKDISFLIFQYYDSICPKCSKVQHYCTICNQYRCYCHKIPCCYLRNHHCLLYDYNTWDNHFKK